MTEANRFAKCFLERQQGGIGFQELFHPDFYFKITRPDDMGVAIFDQFMSDIPTICPLTLPMFWYCGYYSRIAIFGGCTLLIFFNLFRLMSVSAEKIDTRPFVLRGLAMIVMQVSFLIWLFRRPAKQNTR